MIKATLPRPLLQNILIATLLIAIASGLSLWLKSSVGRTQFALFYAAIFLSAWRGGLLPGFLTITLGTAFTTYFMFEPIGSFAVAPQEITSIIVFISVGALISILCEYRLISETKLLRVNELLELVFSNMTDGILVQDKNLRVVVSNRAAKSILNLANMPVMAVPSNMSIGDFYATKVNFVDEQGKEIPLTDMPVRKALATGAYSEKLLQVRTNAPANNIDTIASREVSWIHVKASPVLDEDSLPGMVVTILQDRTAEYQLEQANRDAQARMRKLMDGLSIFAGLISNDGKLVEVNRYALKFGGLEEAQVLGIPFENTLWWNHSEDMQEKLVNAMQQTRTGQTARFTAYLDNAQGELVPFEFMLAPYFNDAGEMEYIVPSGIDISERTHAEIERANLTLALEAQSQRYQTLLANVPGVIWEASITPDGRERIEFVSDYANTLLGYTAREIISTPNLWEQILSYKSNGLETSSTAMVLDSSQTPYRLDVAPMQGHHKAGQTLYLENYRARRLDNHGRPVFIRGVLMDVTARKQAEAKAQEYVEQLHRSNKALEQFAFVASHDLQEPLRMIASYLELLETRYRDKLDEDGIAFIDFAVDGAKRMKALIMDLLSYCRLDTADPSFTVIELELLVKKVLKNLQLAIEESQATITMEAMPTIWGSENQLTQVFQNLISNALKFKGKELPQVHITSEQKGGEWQFSVKDNGIGIDPKYAERIFVIFQRLHSASKYPGTGIGLAICQKVVERHGGRIWVESARGQGSTFYFTLPIHTNSSI